MVCGKEAQYRWSNQPIRYCTPKIPHRDTKADPISSWSVEGGSGYKTSSTSFHIPHTNEYGCMWHRALLPCSYELEVLKKRREPGTIYHNNLSVFCAISDDEMISSLRLQLEIIHYDYIITKHLLLSCMHH